MTAPSRPLIALAAGGTGGHVFPAVAVAEALARHFAPHGAYVIPEDDYYIDATAIPDFDADTFNFDEPAAKDHGLLAAHLGCLKAGETVDAPLYDFKTHRRRAETVQRQPAPVILVEGLHLHIDQILRAAGAHRLDDIAGAIRRQRQKVKIVFAIKAG